MDVKSFKRYGGIMNFKYEYIPTQEEVRKHIQECEGKHTQQAIYSTYHDALRKLVIYFISYDSKHICLKKAKRHKT